MKHDRIFLVGLTASTILAELPAVAHAADIAPTPEEDKQALYDAAGATLRRFGDPEAGIDRAIVYLVGPDDRNITGCTLSVVGRMAIL